MFYSGNFIYDNKYSDEYNIHLVSEDGDILNEYGINFTEDEEITLTFCYANEYDEPLEWDSETLEFVHEWFISDDFKPFVSEDNEDVMYLLKGKSIVKRFTPSFTGLIDVTFETYSRYAYYRQRNTVNAPTTIKINNPSNLNKTYKPVLSISEIKSNVISLDNISNDSMALVLDNLNTIDEIIVDNEVGVVTDSKDNNLMKHCNRKWLEFQKGSNEIKIDGDCVVTIESLYPIMM